MSCAAAWYDGQSGARGLRSMPGLWWVSEVSVAIAVATATTGTSTRRSARAGSGSRRTGTIAVRKVPGTKPQPPAYARKPPPGRPGRSAASSPYWTPKAARPEPTACTAITTATGCGRRSSRTAASGA
ncbi:hypothetical protein CCO04_02175 [Pimelobacter sp. 30-1]|nr:hypothetical protein [Pimelobacter sp. 30-1]